MGNPVEPRAPLLLVVDDDHKLVPLLERGLRYEGFGVACAYSGTEALSAARSTAPDLVLLDVGMPDLDGFEVLRELRRHSDVPVVMLTAKDEVSDKVGALDLGADDYVAKPFAIDELVARIRAVLRRRGAEALDRLSYDDLVCDLGTREVTRAGRRIELTVTEFDVLTCLVRNPRRIQSRETLLRIVWGYDVPVDSNVVDVHIGHLRRKLGDPPLIQTMRHRLRAAQPAMSRLHLLPPLSLRTRLAATFTLLVGVLLVLVGVATNQLLRDSLLAEIERDVAHRAAAYRASPPAPPYTLDTFGAPDVFLQVVRPDGTPLARSGSLGDRTLPLPDAARRGEVVEVRVAGRPLFLTAAPVGDGHHVVVARSPMTTYGALRTLRNLLTAVIAAAVLLTALASWLYARGALRPIGQVVAAARSVRDSHDLSRRVPQHSSGDEVGNLVETFNEMLAELEDAYRSLDRSNQQMRQFLADCSHELRAPLARIRSTVDVLGRLDEPTEHLASDDVAFRSQALADVAADTDRMARMVRQLLILARADAGATIERRPLSLADVVVGACRQAARMANGVKLLSPATEPLTGAMVRGDADHLEQALLILLDNAFKYTPPPGQVRVATRRDGMHAQIDVTDTGLGIPPEDRSRIFERFYRGRNATAATGTGLGLAIASWIATQHGGTLELRGTPSDGSCFTLRLPLATVSEQTHTT